MTLIGRNAVCHTCEESQCSDDHNPASSQAYVGVIENGGKNPVKDHETNSDIHFSPPRSSKRVANPGDLGPIECQ